LLQVIWPAKYKNLLSTKPVYAADASNPQGSGAAHGGALLFNGLTLSLGMSCGPISKNLTQSRAQFTGPTCNRAARVCSLAQGGKLLVFEHEFLEHQAAFDAAGIGCTLLLESVQLKGVQGKPNVVVVDTDAVTQRRAAAAAVNRPMGTGF
jgi:class 3 adenylate cyclase